jgi:hypothetical protein
LVVRQAYGEGGPGPGIDFDEMEEIAAAATAGLVEGTLEHLTQSRAGQLPGELACPTCQKSCAVQHRPRSIVTRGANVTLQEPVAHCPACRRDFFPAMS